jgi:hypothetical protein
MRTKLIILGLLVAVGIAVAGQFGSVVSVTNEQIIVEKTMEVDKLDKRIKEAVDAAGASTTAKAQAAYDTVYQEEMKRIEDEVKATYIAEIEATITDPSY